MVFPSIFILILLFYIYRTTAVWPSFLAAKAWYSIISLASLARGWAGTLAIRGGGGDEFACLSILVV